MSEPAGPSKNMSVEEVARDANKSFWEASQELEEEEAAAGAASGDRADDEQEGPEDDCNSPILVHENMNKFSTFAFHIAHSIYI